jgi:hypothetical protein
VRVAETAPEINTVLRRQATLRPRSRKRCAYTRVLHERSLHRGVVPVRLEVTAKAAPVMLMYQSAGMTEARRKRCALAATAATALMCALLLCATGCGGTPPNRSQTAERYGQELRATVASVVSDEQRRNQLLHVVDEMQALQLRFSRETADFIDSYRKLNADYETKRPVLDQLFADYSRKRVTAREQALDLHFKLATLATPTEWDAIGKAEAKLYKKVNSAPVAGDST